jgi:hypothetical protein
VISDVLHTAPFIWAISKHLFDEIFEFWRRLLGEVAPKHFRFPPQCLVELNGRKRVLTHNHHKQNHSEGVDISFFAFI